jgi:hypothetical protein
MKFEIEERTRNLIDHQQSALATPIVVCLHIPPQPREVWNYWILSGN